MPLNEPRISDPNPKRTAANWEYIKRCEAKKKKAEKKK